MRTLLVGVIKGRTIFTVCCGQDVSENGANNGRHLIYCPNEVSKKKRTYNLMLVVVNNSVRFYC